MQSGSSLTPKQAMSLAIEEARRGAGFVAPNPLVGCVIVDKDHKFLSSGFHAACGADHAEIDAIKNLKNPTELEGATVYVTLEPCAHEGRTPSCAKALAKLPISSVVYGLRDPNPMVSGKGIEILESAGKSVATMDEVSAELTDLAEIFLHNMKTARPFVAVKVATSLDGQMALKTGESQWITNEAAREHSHYLRGCYDAVLVGVGTYLADDPSLNVRHSSFKHKDNKVVVLDPQGRCLSNLAQSNLYKTHPADHIIIVVSADYTAEVPLPIQVVKCEKDRRGQFDLSSLLSHLYELGVFSIYVEGGAHTFAQLLQHRDVQRIYQFLAPSIVGAKNGLSWTQHFGLANLEDRLQLRQTQIFSFADNFLVTGRLF